MTYPQFIHLGAANRGPRPQILLVLGARVPPNESPT